MIRDLKGRVADRRGRLRLMEVCGTHTHAFGSTGLRGILSRHVDLRSGPGCPVCVTSAPDIARCLDLAFHPRVILCTYGDMLRVPAGGRTLADARAHGADVRVVYGPADALAIARSEPDRFVVFLGVGFETTAPALALALREVEASRVDNFFVFSLQKTVPEALGALFAGGALGLDGLILPGHVATIIGRVAFDFLARSPGIPAVITGFEPLDLLHGLDTLVGEIEGARTRVVNAYPRAVRERGNATARSLVAEYFHATDARWRGLGAVPESGLSLRAEYRHRDAEPLISADGPWPEDPPGCDCAAVLTGRILPTECTLFGDFCTPEDPVGPCMVSSEGACAAHYLYRRGGRAHE